jgi:hypothetical protein
MHITLGDFCAMVVFFVLQAGTVLVLAICDLRGIRSEWCRGYLTTSNFVKIAIYSVMVLFAAFTSMILPLAYRFPGR